MNCFLLCLPLWALQWEYGGITTFIYWSWAMPLPSSFTLSDMKRDYWDHLVVTWTDSDLDQDLFQTRLVVLIKLDISVPSFFIRILGVILSIEAILISALDTVTGISITITALFSMGIIVLIEIVTTIIVLIFFLYPHHILIHRPLTYHSYHQPLSLPHVYQHLQSTISLHSCSSSIASFICLFQSPALTWFTQNLPWRSCRWRVPLQCYTIPQVQVHCHPLERVQ